MSSPIYRHDLDPTGLSPDNRVLREPVALANYPVRVFVPSFGAFFGDSMVITDTGTGAILLKSQYYLSQPAHIPTLKYGKGIYYCVVITDASVSANLSIDYQDLGGEWAYSNSALATQLQVVLGDARAVDYSAIINKPDRFSPGPHLHDAGDVFGMEYLIEALYAIRDSISLDGTASMIAIYDQTMKSLEASAVSVQAVRTELYQSINGLLNQLASLQSLSFRVTVLENASGNAATYITSDQLAAALAAYAIAHPATVAGGTANIPGEVRYFAFATAPDCWRVADGAILGRVDYPELFAAIGTTFNHDESLLGDMNRFQLPDLRGEFIRGLDNGRGIDAGRVLGSAQTDDFKSHTHPLNLPGYYGGATPNLDTNGGSGQNYTSGATGGIETRPRNVALLPCICYTAGGGIADVVNPTYSIMTGTDILIAGLSAIYTVQTTGISSGTVLYWTISSFTLNGNDFTDNAVSGTVTINNNVGVISRTLDAMLMNGGNDLFAIELRTESITGAVVAISNTVRTMPAPTPTYRIAPSVTSVNEGSAVTFNVTTTNVPNGTVLAYLIAGTAVGADFVDGVLEGTYTINNNAGSFVKNISADSRTEGTKAFNASVTLNVGSGTTLWTSETVVINDTSLTPVIPTYSLTANRTSLNALDQVVFTLSRTNGTDSSGTLYYIDVSCADLSCVILSGVPSHVYSVTLTKIDGINPTISFTNTGYSEQNNSGNDQTALINLRDGSHTGPILASSPSISLTIDIQN